MIQHFESSSICGRIVTKDRWESKMEGFEGGCAAIAIVMAPIDTVVTFNLRLSCFIDSRVSGVVRITEIEVHNALFEGVFIYCKYEECQRT